MSNDVVMGGTAESVATRGSKTATKSAATTSANSEYDGPVPPPRCREALLRADSRWKNLPRNGGASQSKLKDTNPRDIALYIKDVKTDRDVSDVLQRAYNTKANIARDFVFKDGKKTKVALEGNKPAERLIAELDGLIMLARSIWSNPDDLSDWIQDMFQARYRNPILNLAGTKREMLDRALNWVDNWAEVRYRFLNHYLRDDPDHYGIIDNNNDFTYSGEQANRLVHRSAIEADNDLVECRWFNDTYKSLYFHVYRLTIAQARRLKSLTQWDEIDTTMRQVFSWTLGYINRMIDWRQEILRKMARNALQQVGASGMAAHHRGMSARIAPVTTAYHAFLQTLDTLMTEIKTNKKMSDRVWNCFNRRITDLRNAVRASPLNQQEYSWRNSMWPLRNGEGVSTFALQPSRPHNLNFK
ncbi:hypothetical protein F4776DRAFT_119290 [Hypoxylon sp. NC0597]|nr:hypothetical protein F4776DRAFT_119290 [Hypoxylon sp. NC0597]